MQVTSSSSSSNNKNKRRQPPSPFTLKKRQHQWSAPQNVVFYFSFRFASQTSHLIPFVRKKQILWHGSSLGKSKNLLEARSTEISYLKCLPSMSYPVVIDARLFYSLRVSILSTVPSKHHCPLFFPPTIRLTLLALRSATGGSQVCWNLCSRQRKYSTDQ